MIINSRGLVDNHLHQITHADIITLINPPDFILKPFNKLSEPAMINSNNFKIHFVFQVVDIYFTHVNGSLVGTVSLDEERKVWFSLGQQIKNMKSGLNSGNLVGRRRRQDELTHTKSKRALLPSRTKRQTAENLNNVKEYAFRPQELLSSLIDTSEVHGVYDGVAMTIEIEGYVLPWANQSVDEVPPLQFSAYVGKGFVPHKFQFDHGMNQTEVEKTNRNDRIIFITDV